MMHGPLTFLSFLGCAECSRWQKSIDRPPPPKITHVWSLTFKDTCTHTDTQAHIHANMGPSQAPGVLTRE